MALKVVNTESLDAVANAINAKSGTSGAIQFPDGFVDAIGAIQAGGGEDLSTALSEQEELVAELKRIIATKAGVKIESPFPKDVNFYDYDGTLLHSYTVEEAQALTELPELPTQNGLICQGWNYDLETIKAYNRAVDVGATYITDDGKTRLYIRIASEGGTVPLYFNQTVANGVTIDWGDGSTAETVASKGNKNISHTYASSGDYVISLKVADGCTVNLRNPSNYSMFGSSIVYSNMLQKAELGNNVLVSDSMFYQCYALKSVVIPNGVTSIGGAFGSCYALKSLVIPNGVTSIGSYAFNSCYALASVVIPNSVTNISNSVFSVCYALKSVVIPNGVTSINTGVFASCYTLASVVIPNGVTSIGSSVFSSCYALKSLVIPNGVTSIGSSAFYECYALKSVVIPNGVTSITSAVFSRCAGMGFYDFTNHTAVPTLSSTNAFTLIPSDCEIRVPASLVEEWKSATNWATYADKIVGV